MGQHTVRTGDLDSGATWRCDTIEIWTQGQRYSFDQLIDDWSQKGWLRALQDGAHLIITGGEPLLQHAQLAPFLSHLRRHCTPVYVEVETNGTLAPSASLIEQVQQWNVSPKLANSGMALQKRRVESAIQVFCDLSPAAWFKMVVSDPSDLQEIESAFISPFQVPKSQVLLMPAASDPVTLEQVLTWLVPLADAKGYRWSHRQQIAQNFR